MVLIMYFVFCSVDLSNIFLIFPNTTNAESASNYLDPANRKSSQGKTNQSIRERISSI